MIKRRFYKLDKGERSGSSDSDDSSSSDEDSGGNPEADEEEVEEVNQGEDEEEEEEEEEVEVEPVGSKRRRSSSPGSGYESEDSSGNELEDPAGLDLSDDDDMHPKFVEKTEDYQPNKMVKAKGKGKISIENITTDLNDSVDTNYILRSKSVFRCKLCPRIVCLNEESLKAHLGSKRHARSMKLLGEGRLRLMLNSDGEIEEDQETHSERHVRTVALAKKVAKEKESEAPEEKESKAPKNDSGRQRQSKRRKKKKVNHPEKREEKSTEKTASKRHTS